MDQSERVPNTYTRNGVYYGVVEVDGSQIRESLGTRDPLEAAKRVKRWLAEKSPRHANDEFTFAEVASSWIEAYQTELSPKTWTRYKTSLKMIRPFFGKLLWSEMDRAALVKFMNERRAAGVLPATINRDLTVISNIFEHAIDQGWSTENPTRTLSRRARKERREPFTIPTDEMIEAVFARSPGTFGDIARFALLTGLRKDEICGLNWKTNVILDRAQVQLFKTKNRSVRVVNLCPEAVAILTKQKTREGTVFLTRNGDPYTNVSEGWRDLVKRAMKRWSAQNPAHPFTRFKFHDLRHLFAIRYLRNGGNLYLLQIEMGHSTIRQTEDYLEYLSAEEQLMAKGHAHTPAHTSAVSEAVAAE